MNPNSGSTHVQLNQEHLYGGQSSGGTNLYKTYHQITNGVTTGLQSIPSNSTTMQQQIRLNQEHLHGCKTLDNRNIYSSPMPPALPARNGCATLANGTRPNGRRMTPNEYH